MIMTIREIDQAILALNNAIKSHYAWTGHLLSLALHDSRVDETLMDPLSERRCQFGVWLHQLHQSVQVEEGQFISDIDNYHHQMHDQARVLTQAIISQTASQAMIDSYLTAQNQFILSLDRYKEQLFSLRNLHDALTGLPLRHLLYQHFSLFYRRARQRQQKMYIMMMDLDRFKSINDTWGHNAGDDVLRALAGILKEGSGEPQHIYRFGGEEFVMLLADASEQEACARGAALCEYLACHPIAIAGQNLQVTMTGGMACVGENELLHDVIGRADKAMYYGKHHGRNCCVYSDTHGELTRLTP
ncbi:diguanylate cyclase [Shimwellia blattae]|uniref:diguanylate cyclase n=1 Tax=Shimwellia blattae (strain ATCC 29907 / DSM 4481 / JCM 1650 / NBRC 105725 / CDC 9005-74) TaxID=630626 RepID=I2B4Z4_SHIBC|nr:diguanylate cyclase [Shimwellia blattae]AFJ45598.1 diguanylate cyclase (GGDEF) domain protein [Shimwellia blattae DSM 4481 = NBRC 105725]GAB81463.1 diguanylate cyclase YdeH [Shimwellia blattae DSM 4481 = NBRC 105725]VDY63078.1 Diguanylate cyclase YdeH [Shimwellia blattae]VEC20260.1 Diguanylate cyclase YdeH [Shimwellia blattae]